MENLTFAEQVKIVLGRKGMTIKQLAELIEERTGKPMSRQNMTQRLGRDNFQEQDMRLIAEILGCEFKLSILEAGEIPEKLERPEETEKPVKIVQNPKEQELLKKGVRGYFRKTGYVEKPANKEEIVGEINPYTGKEYKTNSVRIHPKRLGYVQVYNREQHKWEDMTEWAFLGYQEKLKMELGKDYEPPTYLD